MADLDAAAARADAPSSTASAPCHSLLFDHPLSVCLSFLSVRRRFRIAVRVSHQWNRVAALPTSNADCVLRMQQPLRDTVLPSQGLLRWASQRAAGVASSSAAFPLLPSPPAVPFGPGTAQFAARSSVECLVAAHLDGLPTGGNVRWKSGAPCVVGPNPPFLCEWLGWPSLARAAYHARLDIVVPAEAWLRRASFEAWCRMSPAHLESLTLCSPRQENDDDWVIPGGGDDEWIILLRAVAPSLAAASATVAGSSCQDKVAQMKSHDGAKARNVFRAIAEAVVKAAAKAAELTFDPAESPFPRLRSLSIEGFPLSWPVLQVFLRACPSIVHLEIEGDESAACKQACAELKTRSPDATVNGVRLCELRCGLCGEQAAPLLTCENESCELTGCGPCLQASARPHFLCHSLSRHDDPRLYCYAPGPCDSHVRFQCESCLTGDSSPLKCDGCGCLICEDHHDDDSEDTFHCGRCDPEQQQRSNQPDAGEQHEDEEDE